MTYSSKIVSFFAFLITSFLIALLYSSVASATTYNLGAGQVLDLNVVDGAMNGTYADSAQPVIGGFRVRFIGTIGTPNNMGFFGDTTILGAWTPYPMYRDAWFLGNEQLSAYTVIPQFHDGVSWVDIGAAISPTTITGWPTPPPPPSAGVESTAVTGAFGKMVDDTKATAAPVGVAAVVVAVMLLAWKYGRNIFGSVAK